MMNPDGVCLGNYRSSLLGRLKMCSFKILWIRYIHAGYDLNRVWNDPNIAHPTVKAAKNVVEEIISNNVIEDMTIGV